MSLIDPETHLIYQVANAPMSVFPYPHFYIENVFPPAFYERLRQNLPTHDAYTSLSESGRTKGAYKERFFIPLNEQGLASIDEGRALFWNETAQWFLGQRFMEMVFRKFQPFLAARGIQPGASLQLQPEILIVKDHTNYSIGPHTDALHRFASLLFYCPETDEQLHLGTSIYEPKTPGFICQGGPHHPHQNFNLVKTMAYKPNSLFAFLKTPNSFHGVEPIVDSDVERDVILYDIRLLNREQLGV